MSLEFRTNKLATPQKLASDKAKTYSSPDKKATRSMQEFYKSGNFGKVTSTSPRYRSPTHSRINLESTDSIMPCPICERRSNELKQSQIFHESPPKIRPSHHNIVCEDCSEGSYSKVLKVVCSDEIYEEEENLTKSVRIIEGVAGLYESSVFPVVGNGKNVQVHYQEIYPPPKQELTSLIPENFRENGQLKYQLKEEERKRVAIRRAEYANRIKGVAKTIVTTISSGGDRLERVEEKIKVKEDDEFQRNREKKSREQSFEPEKISFEDISNENSVSKNQTLRPTNDGIEKANASAKLGDADWIKKGAASSKLSVKQKLLMKLVDKDFFQITKSRELQDHNEGNLDDELEEKVEDCADYNLNRRIENNIGESNEEEKELELNSAEFDTMKNVEFEENLTPHNTANNIEIDAQEDFSFEECENGFITEGKFKEMEFGKTIEGVEDNGFITEWKFEETEIGKKTEAVEDKGLTSEGKIEGMELEKTMEAVEDKTAKKSDQIEERDNEFYTDDVDRFGIETNRQVKLIKSPSSSIIQLEPADAELSGDQFNNFGSNNHPNEEVYKTNHEEILEDFQEKSLKELSKFKDCIHESRHEDVDEANDAIFVGESENMKNRKNKSSSKGLVENIDLVKINLLLGVFADPQVIKGLKLLGGFADYLEKNGKDVLDWKL